MIPKLITELWEKCAGDTDNGICIPFGSADYIKFYVKDQVTAISLISCVDGSATVMALGDWSYVIGTDGNGDTYSYFENPTLPIEYPGCFYFAITTGGGTLYTQCYKDIMLTDCRLRDVVTIGSEYAKFDCLGRWYGLPVTTIDGDANLQFDNTLQVWGTLNTLATEYEFTNFSECVVTKTKAVKQYELEALSIAPYFVEIIEAIIGRGVVTIDGTQYSIQNGTHFEKIRAFCRSQYDMRINMTDCACQINHECDLDYKYVPELECQTALTYVCNAEMTDCVQMAGVTATVSRETGYMEFTFTDPLMGGNDIVRAAEFATLLNDCVLNNYALQILTNIGLYYFYTPYISNVNQVGNVVTFDYSDFFNPPVDSECGVSGIEPSAINWVNDDNWAIFTTQNIGSTNELCCIYAELLFTLTVTGSPLNNVIWSSNVTFTQIDMTHISIALPQGGDIEVTADVFPEICAEVTITVTVNDNPTYEGRFLAADCTVLWDSGLRRLEFTEASYLLNTSVASIEWNVLPLGSGYTGGSPTTGTNSTFTLTGVGPADDFFVELIVTDIHGNISKNYIIFGQDSEAAPDEDVVLWARVTGAAFTGTSVDITTDYAMPYNTYVPPNVADELGLDADLDSIYEQTAPAAGAPVIFTHDYGGTGSFVGRVSVSIVGQLPLNIARCEYACQIV